MSEKKESGSIVSDNAAGSGGEKKPEVSVICGFAQEWPLIVFTLRAVHEELAGIPHEIIAVDNFCDELARQGVSPDRGHRHKEIKKGKNPITGEIEEKEIEVMGHIEAQAAGLSWLHHVSYADKLSHWQAKNAGVRAALAPILLFLDAHVIPARGSLAGMLRAYQANHAALRGSIHLPLSYHILDPHRLIYKLVSDPKQGFLHYSFTAWPTAVPTDAIEPFEVPCMSTCGMMISREIFDDLGGWPTELGIYGGGENYFNFAMSILGYKKWIYPASTLHHHGDKRGYSWNYDDYVRNRMIATYLVGGEEWLNQFAAYCRGDRDRLWEICRGVMEVCGEERNRLAKRQAMSIDAWLAIWKNK